MVVSNYLLRPAHLDSVLFSLHVNIQLHPIHLILFPSIQLGIFSAANHIQLWIHLYLVWLWIFSSALHFQFSRFNLIEFSWGIFTSLEIVYVGSITPVGLASSLGSIPSGGVIECQFLSCQLAGFNTQWRCNCICQFLSYYFKLPLYHDYNLPLKMMVIQFWWGANTCESVVRILAKIFPHETSFHSCFVIPVSSTCFVIPLTKQVSSTWFVME